MASDRPWIKHNTKAPKTSLRGCCCHAHQRNSSTEEANSALMRSQIQNKIAGLLNAHLKSLQDLA